jgi:hypothetical protein
MVAWKSERRALFRPPVGSLAMPCAKQGASPAPSAFPPQHEGEADGERGGQERRGRVGIAAHGAAGAAAWAPRR